MGKVLHASKSGYFPSCIEDDPPEYLKITGSLEDIMSLFWRVKNFKVSVGGSGLFGDLEIPCTFSGEVELETTYFNYVYPQLNITDEASLVCNYNSRDHTHLTGTGLSFTQGVEYGPAFMDMSFQPVISQPSESTYTMRFGFALYENTLNSQTITNSPEGNDVGSWSVNFLGRSITGRAHSNEDGIQSGNFNIDFTATEYWSYGGTYNTSTGEPL